MNSSNRRTSSTNKNRITNGDCSTNCREKISRIWDSNPLFVQFIIVCTLVLYVLNLFLPFISLIFADIPYFTVFYFQIWRLFTSVLMTTGIFSIIFGFIFWVREASSLERSMGTIKYLLVFFINSVLIQVIYCVMMGFIALLFRNINIMKTKLSIGGVRNEGLWPIIMSEITLLCMSNPEAGMHFFFFPCEIKAKYYPFVLFGIFTLLSNFHIDFEVLSGILYGVLYHFYLKNHLQISDSFVQKLENHSLFKWMTMKNSFIFSNSIGPCIPIDNLSRGSSSSGFSAFKGKGISVGSSPDTGKNGYSNINANPNVNLNNSIIETNDIENQVETENQGEQGN